jgi:hypothetical protein
MRIAGREPVQHLDLRARQIASLRIVARAGGRADRAARAGSSRPAVRRRCHQSPQSGHRHRVLSTKRNGLQQRAAGRFSNCLRGLATVLIWRGGGRPRERRSSRPAPRSQAEAASDSRRFNMSGYFRTSQINAAACSFGLLRPCSHRSSVLGFRPSLNANTCLDIFSASRVSRTMAGSMGGHRDRAHCPGLEGDAPFPVATHRRDTGHELGEQAALLRLLLSLPGSRHHSRPSGGTAPRSPGKFRVESGLQRALLGRVQV